MWYESKKNFDEQSEILAKATDELAKARTDKQEAKETLNRLNNEMHQMEVTLSEKKKKLTELEEDLQMKKANLEIAERLVNGLGDEKISWDKERETLNDMYTKLVGDCLLSCAFLTQMGPFESTFRRQIMYNDWAVSITKTKIPQDPGFRVTNFLATEVEKTNWESEGLSADTQSVENGILTLKSTRYPLCIDPQMQAISWIKNTFENTLKIKSMSDDYTKWLEIAIKQGAPFLFENVGSEIDPMVTPILEQNYQIKANSKILNLNGQELEVHENFRL